MWTKKSIHFHPSALAITTTALGISLFVSLGQWQLQRAEEKTQIIERSLQNQAKPIIYLPLGDSKTLEEFAHRTVFFTAAPLANKQFLLDNQIRNGKAGVSVITPFERSDGSLILVDRGWLPLGFSRQQFPTVGIPSQRMRVQGKVYIPAGKAFALGEMDEGSTSWPRLVTHLDYPAMAQRLGRPLPALTVRIDPGSAHGYLRTWPDIASLTPQKNIAYAIQWFGLALTVLVIFLVLNTKRRVAL